MDKHKQLDQLNELLNVIKILELEGGNNPLYQVKLELINQIVKLESELGI